MDKKSWDFWCLICVIIGLIIYLVVFFMWKDYMSAEIKIKTEATIVDLDISTRYKQKNKDEVKDNFDNKYEEYYKFTITWEFTDEARNITKQYEEDRESSTRSAYRMGQKKTIYAYSNDGKNYEVNTLGESIIAIFAGTTFIVIGVIEYISTNKKRKQKETMQEVINKRVQESGNSNIMNN